MKDNADILEQDLERIYEAFIKLILNRDLPCRNFCLPYLATR